MFHSELDRDEPTYGAQTIANKVRRSSGISALGRSSRWWSLEWERGQAALELLVVLPVLALLTFGIIEMGAAWRTHHVVAHTAREGARLTILPGAVENEVRTEMANRLVQGGLAPGDATIEFLCEGNCFAANRTQGDPIEARVSYPHTFHLLGPIANYLGGDGSAYGSVTIRTGIVMSVE